MHIEIKIDEQCQETKVTIITSQITDEVNELVKRLSAEQNCVIAGFRQDCVEILEQEELYRIFAQNGKVIAQTDEGEYILKLRLYEVEERLNRSSFARISNSEIINLKKVRGFDLRLTGTILVTLTNGTVTYVSRRYVTKMKQVLGI